MNSPTPDTKVELVNSYLRMESAQAEGPLYVKARFMAEDLDLSAKEIGIAMRRLADRDDELTIERWGASSGSITWCVSRA